MSKNKLVTDLIPNTVTAYNKINDKKWNTTVACSFTFTAEWICRSQ